VHSSTDIWRISATVFLVAIFGSIIFQSTTFALPEVKWSGETGQRAKMYPTLKTGYTNDEETQFFREV
jgi:hypothetical protein